MVNKNKIIKLELNQKELHLISTALEQVTRLGVYDETIKGLQDKIYNKLSN